MDNGSDIVILFSTVVGVLVVCGSVIGLAVGFVIKKRACRSAVGNVAQGALVGGVLSLLVLNPGVVVVLYQIVSFIIDAILNSKHTTALLLAALTVLITGIALRVWKKKHD